MRRTKPKRYLRAVRELGRLAGLAYPEIQISPQRVEAILNRLRATCDDRCAYLAARQMLIGWARPVKRAVRRRFGFDFFGLELPALAMLPAQAFAAIGGLMHYKLATVDPETRTEFLRSTKRGLRAPDQRGRRSVEARVLRRIRVKVVGLIDLIEMLARLLPIDREEYVARALQDAFTRLSLSLNCHLQHGMVLLA